MLLSSPGSGGAVWCTECLSNPSIRETGSNPGEQCQLNYNALYSQQDSTTDRFLKTGYAVKPKIQQVCRMFIRHYKTLLYSQHERTKSRLDWNIFRLY